MKLQSILLPLTFGITLASSIAVSQAQTALDILRGIQPGQQPSSPSVPAPNATAPVPVPAPPVALDTRPAFMSTVTNYVRATNRVIVTNYVVVTNISLATNYYNAQGQLLQPALPAAAALAGLTPIPGSQPAAALDPKAVWTNQVQAVKDLLSQGLAATSTKLTAPGNYTTTSANQIQIPEGVTVFDAKRAQALLLAMNTAVEKAAPEALAVVRQSALRVEPPAPEKIIQGDNEAATRYLISTDGQNISNQILTIIRRTSADAGVPAAYQSAMLKGGGLLGSVFRKGPVVDMDEHLTRGLTESIIKNLSAQEGLIRTTPSARTTKALQEAFKK